MKQTNAIPKTLGQAFRAGFSLAGATRNMRFQDWKTIAGDLEIVRDQQFVLVPFKAELQFAKPRAPRGRA